MGLGDMFSSIFGGKNRYKFQTSPVMGLPMKGESGEAFRRRQQSEYETQNRNYQNIINRAVQESQGVGGQQGALANTIRQRMGQNIDFSGANQSLDQQQDVINMLNAQARGEGPNPALDQLRMTTDANIRNQAAALASTRGLNPALAARQASQAGAGANQEAAGQAALQSAQQQLGAQQLAGGLLGQRAGLQSQMSGMNAQQQANYAQLLAQTLAGQRAQGLAQQGQTAGQQINYQNLLQNAWNALNNINSGVAAQNANTAGQYGMGIMSGLSGALGLGGMFNEGGEVLPMPKGDKKIGVVMNEFDKGKLRSSSGEKVSNPKQAMAIALSEQREAEGMSHGGIAEENEFAKEVARRGMKMASGGISQFQAFKSGDPLDFQLQNAPTPYGAETISKGVSAGGGKLVDFLKSKFAPEIGDFNPVSIAPFAIASDGGKVNGRAKVKGDSIDNDTVPALLSPGEIVIPRTASDEPEAAHDFLDKIMKKKYTNYGDVLRAKRMYGGGYGN